MDTNSNFTSDAGIMQRLAARRSAATSWETPQGHIASIPATVLCDVAVTALESKNFSSAVRATIKQLCDETGWPIGNSWRKLATGGWESMNLWHHATGGDDVSPSPDHWPETTDQWASLATTEFFDQISVTRGPQWLNAKTDAFESARSDASPFHVQAVVTFPVIAQERVVAVVQLYSQMPIQPDEGFKNILQQIGILLGHVFEREQMERRIAHLAEMERTQIGLQLHDGLSQHLAAAAMLVESLKQRLGNERSTQIGMTTKILLALEEAKQQARALAKMLAPTTPHSDGMAAALSEVAEHSRHALNVDCVFECLGSAPCIKRFAAEQLVRFARDAIYYLCKKLLATRISMILKCDAGITLLVRGDRSAIETTLKDREDNLQVMQTRVHLMGGEFSIQMHGTEGATLICAVPTDFSN